MKVCDKHPDRKSVDTLHCEQDDTYVDVCDECKHAVMSYLLSEKTQIEEPAKKTLVQKVFGK